jgi:hypothetical protein
MACDVQPECKLDNVTVVWDENDTCPVCNKLFLKDDDVIRCGTATVHTRCAWCIVCGSRNWAESAGQPHMYRIFPGRGIMHEECTRCGICNYKPGEGIIERYPRLFVVKDECGLFSMRSALYHASCIGCQCIHCEIEREHERYRPSGVWARWDNLPVDKFAEVAYHFERRYGGKVLDPCCRECMRCGMPVVYMAASQYTIEDYPVAHEVCKRCNKCMCKYKDNRDHVKCLPKLNMKGLSISTKQPRGVRKRSKEWKKQLEHFM